MSDGDAILTIYVAGMQPIKLIFSRVRWHQFTAVYNCTAEQIDGSYFAVAEIPNSSSLAPFIANDRSVVKAYRELHHYRILLDETGCHEAHCLACRSLHLLREIAREKLAGSPASGPQHPGRRAHYGLGLLRLVTERRPYLRPASPRGPRAVNRGARTS